MKGLDGSSKDAGADDSEPKSNGLAGNGPLPLLPAPILARASAIVFAIEPFRSSIGQHSPDSGKRHSSKGTVHATRFLSGSCVASLLMGQQFSFQDLILSYLSASPALL